MSLSTYFSILCLVSVVAATCGNAIGCHGDPNANFSNCTSHCPQTCDDLGTGKLCIASCAPPGCVCKSGYVLSSINGKCVKTEECPKGCKGDLNAKYSDCPSYCQLTCDNPDNSGTVCIAACAPPGCVCKPGYLKNNKGKCVLPEGCPGGIPDCGANKTYVPCKLGCPTNFCPTTDIRAMVACSMAYPCPAGCACNNGYLFQDDIDYNCILSSDCAPVNCTRPNEIWDRSPSNCYLERCEDRHTKCDNNYPSPPRCVCKPGYYRNDKDICIPASKCPPICSVSNECLRTCASPNPPNCPYEPSKTNIDGCSCMEGYILSDIGGKCIKIGECPRNGSCNGDPNARPKRCPVPCPSTCKSPEAIPCKKGCDPIGCECKPGYILSKYNGQCIKPDKCPGGNPCGPNANFVPCKNGCPTDYCPVDDNRGILICEPTPEEFCLSGCRCKLNHKWLSREDKRCIVSSDCPKVNCTRPHEMFDSCPSACLRENCEDVNNQPTTCQTLVLNCEPRCVCKKKFFRNDEGICVPPSEC